MNTGDILDGLLLASIALSFALVLVSTAAAGRTMADLERQAERGVTGTPRIQAWVNLRTNLNRAALGVVFATINLMLLANAPEPYRMWTNRSLWTLLLASFVVMGILDWIAERDQVRLAMRELAEARSIRDELVTEAAAHRAADVLAEQASYQQIALEAVQNLEAVTNTARREHGEPPLVILAPVVAEHQSPTTDRQQATAEVATLRARLVAATLTLGLPPRDTPGDASVDAVSAGPEPDHTQGE